MGRTACTESQCLYKGALYLTKASKPLLESTQIHIRLIKGFLPSGVKRCGGETNDSPPSSSKVQNRDTTSSNLPHGGKAFHRDTLHFTIYSTMLDKAAYSVVI